MPAPAPAAPNTLSTASLDDTLGLLTDLVLPILGKGVLIRRPKMVGLAERLGLDVRAVKRLQRLRDKHGAGPVLLPIPGKPQLVLLHPADVHRVLIEEAHLFTSDSTEKHAALRHFEPKGSLISRQPARAERRRFSDDVLESGRGIHGMADRLRPAIDDEAGALLAGGAGELTYGAFSAAWFRVARQIVLGRGARDDDEVTQMLNALRLASNWVYFRPRRNQLLHRFRERLQSHLDRAEPGSLAERIAARSNNTAAAPVDQVTQWLFAFDGAAIATYRALALLATHADARERARNEVEAASGGNDLPFLRAALLESLRLWPTTPAILRQTTTEVAWAGGTVPKDTQVLIYSPFFHRDDSTLPFAHRFDPDIWIGHGPGKEVALVPFSEGPGVCPAHHLAPMLGSFMLAAILAAPRLELTDLERLDANRPLPGTLDHFTLRFNLRG